MKTVTYENITISEEVAVRMAMRCTAIGCDVDDYIEQALTYAMDNEDTLEGWQIEEENHEDR